MGHSRDKMARVNHFWQTSCQKERRPLGAPKFREETSKNAAEQAHAAAQHEYNKAQLRKAVFAP
jgi:hypothetical protein